MTTRNDIERVLWSACDSFRNKIDSSRYKDYILAMLFIKYLSDVYRETREKYIEEYSDGRTDRGKALRKAISEKLGFDSLDYQNIDGVLEAIGLDKDSVCTYCWNGKE